MAPPKDMVDLHFEILRQDVVRKSGGVHEPQLQRNPGGTATITVPGVNLPSGWNRSEVTVYFVAPAGYPVARPDTFWTDQLFVANGAPPANTGTQDGHCTGKANLTWFSYHPSVWDANNDNFVTYLTLIGNRLKEPR